MDADRAAVTKPEVAAVLAGSAFAESLARGAPLILASGRPMRVAFATPAALALFGVETAAALDAVALDSRSPGAQRLRRLAETLDAGKPPRLESLRFYASRIPLAISLACARIVSRDGRDFLVFASPRATAEAEPAQMQAPAASPAQPDVSQPEVRLETAPPRRFLWTLDADDRFGASDGALEETAGAHAPQPGEPLGAFRARVGLDIDGALASAIVARRTFSALRLAWPEAGQPTARVVLLSGTPAFDKNRSFLGFRGFGLFTGETVASPTAPPPLSEAAPPALDEPEPAHERQAAAPEPERSAEIFVLRQTPPQQPGLNVVPIRPGALAGFAFPPEKPRRVGDERETVELTSDERDAFREIARTLGARLPPREEKRVEAEKPDVDAPRPRDLIDLTASAAPHEASPSAASEALAAPSARGNADELLDRLPIGAMVLRGGEPVFLNRTLLDLAGYADLTELRAADGIAHMFRGRDAQTLAEESAGGAIPLVTASGELVPVEAHLQSIVWDGAPATVIALRRARDVESDAELRGLQRELRAHDAAARDLEAALEAVTDGVLGLDATGRILSMNGAARVLFGYEANEVVGESFLMLFAPQSQGDATARLEQIKQERAPRADFDGELTGRDRRGQPIALALAMARVAGPSASPHYRALIRDLSSAKAKERKLEATREQAEQASARKTDFLARISHEVRTPLHAILGFAEVIIEERFGPIGNDRYKDYIKDIHASAKHVMSLANDLLDLAKIEAGKMELEFAPVDANRIVRECVSLMQPQAAQERIIVRLSLFDKLPNVMADERSLRQILLNLMSNAVKFNEPGGQVIVSTAVDEAGHPVIRVRDTGAGMNEGELIAALEPFRQVGGGHRAGGAGLGLPLTKALAEANHAGFSIKSRKEQGTLVEVAFPSAKAAQ